MLAHADVLPLAVKRIDDQPRRDAVARSAQPRRDVGAFDRCEIGREGYPPHDHGSSVVWASAWVVFYIIVAIHYFTA